KANRASLRWLQGPVASTLIPVAGRTWTSLSSISSKGESHAAPHPERGAWSVERGMHERVISGDRRQWPRDERFLVRKSRRPELSGSIVMMVQQIVDFRENLHALVELIPRPEVEHTVSGRSSRSEIVDPIGPALVILVSARIGARNCDEVEV